MRTSVAVLALCALLAACGSTATSAAPTQTPDRRLWMAAISR